MSKVYGLQGYLVGKLGASVFAVRNGEQIARQYNPSPANPKTAGQIECRAKLKLLSQLSAALAGVIAIPRVGMKSPRNGFTAANYPYTTYGNNTASEDLADIQLTKSAKGLPGFAADRGSGTAIAVSLNESASSMNDAVVYVVLRRTDANKVAVASSLLVTTPGNDGLFAASLPMQTGDIAICAYGIKYNTAAARVAFGNLTAPSAQGVAQLFISRQLNAADATMTETRGLYMQASDNQGETAGVTRVSVAVNVVGSGSVSGAGRYEVGSYANLVATAGANAQFEGYYSDAACTTLVSSSASYTFEVETAVELYAKFVGAPVTITASSNSVAGGSASVRQAGSTSAGGASASINIGDSAEFTAVTNSGYRFTGWYRDSSLVSSNATYTMVVTEAVTLQAVFEEVQEISVEFNTTNVNITSATIDGQAVTNGGTYTGAVGSPVAVSVQMNMLPDTIAVYKDSVAMENSLGTLSNTALPATGTITIPSDATKIIIVAQFDA